MNKIKQTMTRTEIAQALIISSSSSSSSMKKNQSKALFFSSSTERDAQGKTIAFNAKGKLNVNGKDVLIANNMNDEGKVRRFYRNAEKILNSKEFSKAKGIKNKKESKTKKQNKK